VAKVSLYDTDELHETMGLLPIITPYLTKIYAHQNEIEDLKGRVAELEDTIKYVVLTEGENHEHVIRYF
jgi:hypothetical protein